MKNRLNILCLLVMLVLGYSVIQSAYLYGSGFVTGIKAGEEMRKTNPAILNQMMHLKVVNLAPTSPNIFTDSVYNEKSGSYVPVIYSELGVSVKTELEKLQLVANSLLQILNTIIIVTIVVMLVKLLISINKSNIFNWKNVSRLRWVGVLLIISFCCNAIPQYLSNYMTAGAFSLEGYEVHIFGAVSLINLVLGFVGLIVGEVFAIGLRMQEEQELTI